MATIASTVNGLYSSIATWAGGVVPVEGDLVEIRHEVTVDGFFIAGSDTGDKLTGGVEVMFGGTLIASRTVSNELTCKGTLYVRSGGNMDYGTSADPIPAGITAGIVTNYSDTLETGKYGFEPHYSTNVYMHGHARTQVTTTTADIAVGDVILPVADASIFNVGEQILIRTTSSNTANQAADIQSISGNDLTLHNFIQSKNSTPVSTSIYNHASGVEVFLLTSNVYVKTYSTDHLSWVMSRNGSSYEKFYHYVEFSYIARDTSDGNNYGLALLHQNNSITEFDNNIIKFGNDGLDFYTCVGGFEINDNICFSTVSGIYFRAGSRIIVNDGCVVGMSNAIRSSYSQGGVNCEVNRTIVAGNSSGVSCNPVMGLTLNDAVFEGNDRNYVNQQSAPITFNRIKFNMGVGTPVSNILVDVAVRASTVNLLVDCEINLSSITTLVQAPDEAHDANSIALSNVNLDPLQQFVYSNAGTLSRDNTFFREGSPSVKLDLISASKPLTFPMSVFAPTGKPVIASGYIYRDSAYTETGTLPKVTISGLGITPDTFVCPDVVDEWVQFKVQATQTTGTDGMLNLLFEGQSAAGIMWVDDVIAPVAKAVSVGEMANWENGYPVSSILANFTSAADSWNEQSDNVTLNGSMGVLIKDMSVVTDRLNALIEDVGGDRLTTKALEVIPNDDDGFIK